MCPRVSQRGFQLPRPSSRVRGNGGVSKILQNDVLGSGFHAPSGSDLEGTRPWRRASTGPFRRCGGRGLGVTQRGSRDAAQAPATNRASPESRSAPPSTLMSLRAACDLRRQAFGFVSLPSGGEGWQDHTSWKSPLAPLTHATVCVRAITVHPCSHLWLGCGHNAWFLAAAWIFNLLLRFARAEPGRAAQTFAMGVAWRV